VATVPPTVALTAEIFCLFAVGLVTQIRRRPELLPEPLLA